MSTAKKIYVAATGQNRGKTTLCLGLINAMRKRGLRVGFIKPIGQRYTEVDGKLIDEDAVLVDSIFSLGDNIEDTSPVAVERGFTQKYIRGVSANRDQLLAVIGGAIDRVSAGKDVVVVEGTGHAGDGAVFDLSNAAVAQALGLKAVMVSGGGIGRPIDELVLNRSLFREHAVPIVGTIINKVDIENYEKVGSLVRMGLERLDMRVTGVIPFVPLLSYLTMELIVEAVDGVLLAGKDNLDRMIKKIVVGAMTAHRAVEHIDDRSLVITPGDRDDILLAVLSLAGNGHRSHIAGLMLTGGITPHDSIMQLISDLQIPTFVVKSDTYRATSEVHDLLVKIRPHDTSKIAEIFRLVSEHVDVDAILDAI